MEEKILVTDNKKDFSKTMVSALVFIVLAVIYLIYGFISKIVIYLLFAPLFLIYGIIMLCFYFASKKVSLTVSDKRVFGCTAFGKRVDLPIDSISAVATSAFKGIAIGTSSGRISFKFIGNNKEIHKVISDLIIERQNKSAVKTIIAPEVNQSNADELKKYKELLDMGAITQEEFDIKKNQLLGL